MKKLLILMCILLSSSCVYNKHISEFSVISVDSSGTDYNKIGFCSDFNLSTQEASSYFEKAIIITAEEMHNKYSYLPCFVQGKCMIGAGKCTWEIRAGGTASIEQNGKVNIYGCQSCELF